MKSPTTTRQGRLATKLTLGLSVVLTMGLNIPWGQAYAAESLPIFNVTVSKSSVRILDDRLLITPTNTGAACQMYATSWEASAAAGSGKSACSFELTTPYDLFGATDSTSGQFAGRFGYGATTGPRSLPYKISYYAAGSYAGQVLTEGQLNVTVNPSQMDTWGNFDLVPSKKTGRSIVDTFSFTPTSVAGSPCLFVTSVADASASWSGSETLKCNVVYPTTPSGLTEGAGGVLSGNFAASGSYTLGAYLQIFTNQGYGHLTLVTKQTTVDVTAPMAPSVGVDGEMAFAGSSLYRIGDNGVVGKIRLLDGGASPVTVAVQRNADAAEVFASMKGTDTNDLTMPISTMALWEQRTVTLASQYDVYPSLKGSTTVTVVKLPPKTMEIKATVPDKIIGTDPLSIPISLGVRSGSSLNYQAANMGTWKAQLAIVDLDGSFRAITDPMPVVNGAVTLVYAQAANNLDKTKLVVVATLDSNLPGYESKLTSTPVTIATAYGDAIPVTATTSKASGAAPLQVKLTASIAENLIAIGDVTWLISNDGGTSWADAGVNGLSPFLTINDTGTYQVRALTRNKNSGLTAFSEPVAVNVFGTPNLSVQGRTLAFAGTNTTLTASGEAASVKWSIKQADGSTQDVAGRVLSLTSALPQKITATLWSTNESDPALMADPSAWTGKDVIVTFISPAPLSVALTVPRSVEVGRQVELAATVRTAWDNKLANYTLKSKWTKPNGTEVSGASMVWTPSKDEYDLKQVPVFSAWVDEASTGTLVTATPKFTLLNYVWPNWSLVSTLNTDQAPALVKLAVTASTAELTQLRNFAEPVTYAWEISETAQAVKAKDRSGAFVANLPGDYLVRVTISDTRGHQSILDKTLTITPPDPMSAKIKLSSNTKYVRVPYEVTIKPEFSGGHPQERVKKFRFFKNDALAQENTTGRLTTTFTEAGTYQVRVDGETTLGRTASGSTAVTVAANQAPACTLEGKTIKTIVLVTATCQDPDGRIVAFEWSANDVKLRNQGNRVTVPVGTTVSVTVKDNSGAVVTLDGQF